MTEKQEYIKFCENRKDIPMFFMPKWLEAVTNGQWDVILSKDKGGEIHAIMPYVKKTNYLLSAIHNPLLTPYQGIYFFNQNRHEKEESLQSFKRQVGQEIIEKLPKTHYFKINFHPQYVQWLPFYFNGFKQTTYFSYILNDIKDLDTIFNGFRSNLKNKIRKAESEITIEESDDLGLLYLLSKKSFERQKLNIPYTFEYLEKIDEAIKDNRKILVARDSEGNPHAAQYLVMDELAAYNLILGTDSAFSKSGAASFLLWTSIQMASKYVDTYDFEGSRLPQIQSFFEGFGGRPTPYSQIYKAKNKFWFHVFFLTGRF